MASLETAVERNEQWLEEGGPPNVSMSAEIKIARKQMANSLLQGFTAFALKESDPDNLLDYLVSELVEIEENG